MVVVSVLEEIIYATEKNALFGHVVALVCSVQSLKLAHAGIAYSNGLLPPIPPVL